MNNCLEEIESMKDSTWKNYYLYTKRCSTYGLQKQPATREGLVKIINQYKLEEKNSSLDYIAIGVDYESDMGILSKDIYIKINN